MKKPTIADYPLAETQGDRIRGRRGIAPDEITLDAVLSGRVEMEDLRITQDALRAQAAIADAAGRHTLARNFERGAELVDVPQDVIMDTYEMLRPGRVRSKSILTDRAEEFRSRYGAPLMADFIDRAAEIYLRRGLLKEE
ncbi:MAG: hypothetical protein KDJ82_10275 [Rhodobacteraceae bacterium]|jgi:propanediol dehydratase small subunit|nr:hypothetical protein [Paracoccaceae bacterium]